MKVRQLVQALLEESLDAEVVIEIEDDFCQDVGDVYIAVRHCHDKNHIYQEKVLNDKGVPLEAQEDVVVLLPGTGKVKA